MINTLGRWSLSAMIRQRSSEMWRVSMFKSFLLSKELSLVRLSLSSKPQSWNSSVRTAKQLDSWMFLQDKIPSYRPSALVESESTKYAPKIPSWLCQTAKCLMFRTWRSKKTLKKSPVGKLPEPTTWWPTDTTLENVFQVTGLESRVSWSSVTPEAKRYPRVACMWLVYKRPAKEHLFNTRSKKSKLSREWPKTPTFTKKFNDQSLLVYMVMRKSRKQSLACYLVDPESSCPIKLF